MKFGMISWGNFRGEEEERKGELVELVFGIRSVIRAAGENGGRILGSESIFLGNVLPSSRCV